VYWRCAADVTAGHRPIREPCPSWRWGRWPR
jgi:hypothetical protein